MGEIVSFGLLVYLGIGTVFGLMVSLGAITHPDPVYQSSSRRVRLVLLPGFVLLWPLLVGGSPGLEVSDQASGPMTKGTES